MRNKYTNREIHFTTTPLAAYCHQCCFSFTWQSSEVWCTFTCEVIGRIPTATHKMKQCPKRRTLSFENMALVNITSLCNILKCHPLTHACIAVFICCFCPSFLGRYGIKPVNSMLRINLTSVSQTEYPLHLFCLSPCLGLFSPISPAFILYICLRHSVILVCF